MRRTTLILVAILIVAVIGGGVFFYLNKGKVANILSGNANTANTNTAVANTNTVTANANLSTSDVLKGDKDVNKQLTVAGVTLTMTTALKDDTYDSVKAPAGKQFVVVYFDGIDAAQVPAVSAALSSNAHLLDGKTTITMTGSKVATNVVKNDRGYLKFVVPSDDKTFILEFGTGDSAQHIALAF